MKGSGEKLFMWTCSEMSIEGACVVVAPDEERAREYLGLIFEEIGVESEPCGDFKLERTPVEDGVVRFLGEYWS